MGKHNFGAMLGYSMRQQQYRYMWGKANNVPEGKDEWLYLSQGNAEGVTLGDDGYCYRGQSYFTRLSYDYAGKYLLTFTMRADGSPNIRNIGDISHPLVLHGLSVKKIL